MALFPIVNIIQLFWGGMVEILHFYNNCIAYCIHFCQLSVEVKCIHHTMSLLRQNKQVSDIYIISVLNNGKPGKNKENGYLEPNNS